MQHACTHFSSSVRTPRYLTERLEQRLLLCFSHASDAPQFLQPAEQYTEVFAAAPTAGPEGGPANIVWVNRLFGDNFAALYGANEVAARTLVDRAITDWERVISSFNYSDATNTYNLTLLAETGPPGTGITTDVDNDGKPRAGRVKLDDTGGQAGWYFDPNPGTSLVPDDSEFDQFVAPFNNDSGPFNDLDFYMIALHEIGHALGIGSTDSDPGNDLAVVDFIDYDAWVIDPNNSDDGCAPNDPNCADPGDHVFPVNFNGGAVDYTLTDAGSNDHPNTFPAHLYEGPAVAGWPFHPNELLNDGRILDNNVDQRLLIGDDTASFLRDIYGFTINMPSQINTFHANLDTVSNDLQVDVLDGNFNDVITVDIVGADLRVQVNGTSELIPVSEVDSIVIDADGGDDTINIYGTPTGVQTNVFGGLGNDTINIGNNDLDTQIRGPVMVSGGSQSDALRLFDQDDLGADPYTITNTSITKPGTFFGGVTYSNTNEIVVLTANDLNNLINIESVSAGVSLTVNTRTGDDQIIVGGAPAIIGETILGNVAINAGTLGNDLVIFDDTAGAGIDVYALNAGNYQQTGTLVLTFSDAERVELRANNQDSGIAVANTFGYATEILGNDGADLVDVGFGILAAAGNTTVFGGAGADTLRLNDTTAFAPTTFLVNQTGGLPFVDLFNGAQLILYDSISSLIIDAGPFDDSITSIIVPSVTGLTINGRDGNDTIDVQGHPTQNSALFPRVTVDGGAGNDNVDVNTDGAGGARATFVNVQDLGTLAIGVSGRLRLEAGGNRIEVATLFSMPVSGGELDLTDGYFVRRNSTNIAFYNDRVATGYGAGAWNGLGINSSTAAGSALGDGVGLARASDIFGGGGGVIDGIALAANDILLRYTLYGDADLSGGVNSDDFNRLATAFGQPATRWDQGNFNFDNTTNSDDFNMLATNFGISLAAAAGRTPKDLLELLR